MLGFGSAPHTAESPTFGGVRHEVLKAETDRTAFPLKGMDIRMGKPNSLDRAFRNATSGSFSVDTLTLDFIR